MREQPDAVRRHLLAQHTADLVSSLERIDDAAVHHRSLCPGWTRGHVVTHLARNADAMSDLLLGLSEGRQDLTLYTSDADRDRDIDLGAQRPLSTQVADLHQSALLLTERLSLLGPEHADLSAPRTPGAAQHIPVGFLDIIRLNEVVLHHIDLDLDFTFSDVDAETVEILLPVAVRKAGATLLRGEDEKCVVQVESRRVSGTQRAVLAHLARQHTEQLTIENVE